MSLYPTTLFHFTKKENFYKIFESTFKVSYAREKIIAKGIPKNFAAPMVSFCDLKLSELKTFLHYGCFGIGLSKEWANREGLTPVLYITRNSNLLANIFRGIDGINNVMLEIDTLDDLTGINIDNLYSSYSYLQNIYRYIKNYDGELWRDGICKDENYRFANEREWRYVPDFYSEGIPAIVPIEKIQTSEAKKMYNDLAKDKPLRFQPDDIKYLIVEKDDDRIELIDHLYTVKGTRFDENTIKRLSSRILTVDQIKYDM